MVRKSKLKNKEQETEEYWLRALPFRNIKFRYWLKALLVKLRSNPDGK